MTFDINRSFKVIPFVWGEWDGERFRAAGFVGTQLPYLWTRFWWLFTVYDFVRYMILAVLPSSYHPNLEFFLGEFTWLAWLFRTFKSVISFNLYLLLISYLYLRRLRQRNFRQALPPDDFNRAIVQCMASVGHVSLPENDGK